MEKNILRYSFTLYLKDFLKTMGFLEGLLSGGFLSTLTEECTKALAAGACSLASNLFDGGSSCSSSYSSSSSPSSCTSIVPVSNNDTVPSSSYTSCDNPENPRVIIIVNNYYYGNKE